MSVFGSALRLWRLGRDVRGAADAATDTLAAGHGPLAALRTFADATEGKLDDAVVVELEVALRRGLVLLGHAVEALDVVARALADPSVRAGIERAIAATGDAGYRAAMWRVTLRRWLEE